MYELGQIAGLTEEIWLYECTRRVKIKNHFKKKMKNADNNLLLRQDQITRTRHYYTYTFLEVLAI